MEIIDLMDKSAPMAFLALKRFSDYQMSIGVEYELHINHPSMHKALSPLLKACELQMIDMDIIDDEYIVIVMKG